MISTLKLDFLRIAQCLYTFRVLRKWKCRSTASLTWVVRFNKWLSSFKYLFRNWLGPPLCIQSGTSVSQTWAWNWPYHELVSSVCVSKWNEKKGGRLKEINPWQHKRAQNNHFTSWIGQQKSAVSFWENIATRGVVFLMLTKKGTKWLTCQNIG